MTHPETYYDAKRAVQAATKRHGDHLPERNLNQVLAALGWPVPEQARDEKGRIVKVFTVYDLRSVLPDAFQKEHALPGFNLRFSGTLVAASKKNAAEKTAPVWAQGRHNATEGIGLADPADPAYGLAVDNVDQVVIVVSASGAPDSEPILFPVADLSLTR